MTNTVKSGDFFYRTPTEKDDAQWEEIIEKTETFAPPEEIEGMEFVERVVLPVSKPQRKSGDDNSSKNSTRVSNPERDNLNTIETKGINVTCSPPKTVITNPSEPKDEWNDDLFGGYGRSAEFDRLEVKFWIYDRYKICGERGSLQATDEDVTDDAGISDNGKVSAKPPSKEDYVALCVKKIDKYAWGRNELNKWYAEVIDHTLSHKQVESYITTALNTHHAKGRIDFEHATRKDIERRSKIQKLGKVVPLNADGAESGNAQRLERLMFPMMREYIQHHVTQNLCLHNTKVTNHQDYDDANDAIVTMLENNISLIEEFVDHYRVFKTMPMQVKYRMAQKINCDSEIGVIVDYE